MTIEQNNMEDEVEIEDDYFDHISSAASPSRDATTKRDGREVSDEPHSDLLSHLPQCLNFIQQSLSNGGNVLVHCRQGVSRSAAVVVAYLMNAEEQSRDSVLKAVREKRPSVGPNSGFLDQLQLFDEMGCRIHPENIKYKMYLLENGHSGLEFTTAGEGEGVAYKCRQCRGMVARQTDVLPHAVGHWPDWRRDLPETVCTMGVFIMPKAWMQTQIVGVGGRLLCGKCKGKLGAWSTAEVGAKCPCGACLVKGFVINLKKVDVSKSNGHVTIVL